MGMWSNVGVWVCECVGDSLSPTFLAFILFLFFCFFVFFIIYIYIFNFFSFLKKNFCSFIFYFFNHL